MNPQLIVEQHITAFTNKYSVYAAGPNGEKGQLVALAQQKRLAFKEKVTFYADAAKTQEVFSFRAEKVMDIHGRYLVEDSNGNNIGAFKKEFQKSLVNSTWNILDTEGNVRLTIRESSQTLAIIRRFAGFIPIVGDIVEIVILFLRYHFVFTDTATGEKVGKYQKTTLFRDHYLLSMDDATYQQQDWRVIAAMAVALDALQSR
ncbi:MAG: hypothetical protein ACR2FM_03370 [Candidatus Saccharimonadales bacterium]